MAERLSDIVTQIGNIRQLNAVVTAMRGIAASRAQKGRALLAGIEAYTAVISHAIGEALTLLPADAGAVQERADAKRGLILFCAEQGFAGAFSERIFEAAGTDIEAAVKFVVGTRGAAVAAEQGLTPDWSDAMTTRLDGIADFANRLAEALYGYLAKADHGQSRHPILAFSGRLDPHRSAFAAADRFQALCPAAREPAALDHARTAGAPGTAGGRVCLRTAL